MPSKKNTVDVNKDFARSARPTIESYLSGTNDLKLEATLALCWHRPLSTKCFHNSENADDNLIDKHLKP